jgi:hypothetical protein
VSRRGDTIGAEEGRQRLIARGFGNGDADTVLAFQTWMRRGNDPALEPTTADEQYARTFDARAYLEAVAPEKLDA